MKMEMKKSWMSKMGISNTELMDSLIETDLLRTKSMKWWGIKPEGTATKGIAKRETMRLLLKLYNSLKIIKTIVLLGCQWIGSELTSSTHPWSLMQQKEDRENCRELHSESVDLESKLIPMGTQATVISLEMMRKLRIMINMKIFLSLTKTWLSQFQKNSSDNYLRPNLQKQTPPISAKRTRVAPSANATMRLKKSSSFFRACTDSTQSVCLLGLKGKAHAQFARGKLVRRKMDSMKAEVPNNELQQLCIGCSKASKKLDSSWKTMCNSRRSHSIVELDNVL